MLSKYSQSNRLFHPTQVPQFDLSEVQVAWTLVRKTEKIATEIQDIISQRNYSETAHSHFQKNDYHLGLYGQLGAGTSSLNLKNDLKKFLEEQKKTSSFHFSFWAVFEEDEFLEEEFEATVWRELSFLAYTEEKHEGRVDVLTDRMNPGFRFSFSEAELFVVGLHSTNSRHSRRFPRPTLVFNVFKKLEQ